MHDSARVFNIDRQIIREIRRDICLSTEQIAERCGLSLDGAFKRLKALQDAGTIYRVYGSWDLWVMRPARPVDDPQVYAAHQARSRKARETRKNKEYAGVE